jgi:hypothetical protein
VQRTYGLESGAYWAMLVQQDGRCIICMKTARTRRLAVDHDHASGRVRGLLCYRCNQYLGQWENDPIALHNLIVYLWSILEQQFDPVYQPRLPALLPVATAGPKVVRLPKLYRGT